MENDKCYFFFSGYYAVAAASDVLNRYDIPNRIVRTPIFMKGSCSSAVLVDIDNEEICSHILETEKIRIEDMMKIKSV